MYQSLRAKCKARAANNECNVLNRQRCEEDNCPFVGLVDLVASQHKTEHVSVAPQKEVEEGEVEDLKREIQSLNKVIMEKKEDNERLLVEVITSEKAVVAHQKVADEMKDMTKQAMRDYKHEVRGGWMEIIMATVLMGELGAILWLFRGLF